MTATEVSTSTPSASCVQRGPTIYDVAKAADVAASTVSRAFSRPGRVNPRTAQRIFAAARDVGYRTDFVQGRHERRTRSIAVVATDITNPFYAEIIRGAHEAAGGAGYTILLSQTRHDGQFEGDWDGRVLDTVEGVLLTGSRMSHDAIRILAKQKPLVLLNRRVPEVPAVITDNARGMRRAVEHLAELGHQTVTYVAGPEASWADGARWIALTEACKEANLAFRRVGPCNTPTVRAGFEAAEEVLAQKAPAIIAFNDVMAIGVIKGMRRAGVRVPVDVSVLGFDNVPLTEIVDPELTTVAAPLRAMGIVGVNQLIAAIGGDTPSRQLTVLPVKLVVRDSTARVQRRGSSQPLTSTKVLRSAATVATPIMARV